MTRPTHYLLAERCLGRSDDTEVDGSEVASSSDDTEAPSGVASDAMSAGSAFLLPNLNRYGMTATLGL
jgi:hypothetical protein